MMALQSEESAQHKPACEEKLHSKDQQDVIYRTSYHSIHVRSDYISSDIYRDPEGAGVE